MSLLSLLKKGPANNSGISNYETTPHTPGNPHNINRRTFLRNSSLGALVFSLFPFSVLSSVSSNNPSSVSSDDSSLVSRSNKNVPSFEELSGKINSLWHFGHDKDYVPLVNDLNKIYSSLDERISESVVIADKIKKFYPDGDPGMPETNGNIGYDYVDFALFDFEEGLINYAVSASNIDVTESFFDKLKHVVEKRISFISDYQKVSGFNPPIIPFSNDSSPEKIDAFELIKEPSENHQDHLEEIMDKLSNSLVNHNPVISNAIKLKLVADVYQYFQDKYHVRSSSQFWLDNDKFVWVNSVYSELKDPYALVIKDVLLYLGINKYYVHLPLEDSNKILNYLEVYFLPFVRQAKGFWSQRINSDRLILNEFEKKNNNDAHH